MIVARLLFGTVGLLLLAGGGRLVQIQVEDGSRLRAAADRQHSVNVRIPAQRGEILDLRGRVLAGAVRRDSVYVDPHMVADARFAAYSIAPTLRLDPAGLERLLRENADKRFVWLKRRVDPAELVEFNKLRKQRDLRAFAVETEWERTRPFGRLASHVIGFVGADERGLAGVEQACDQWLRGVDGQRSAIVDARNRRLDSDPASYTAPRDGASIVLTLDVYLQQRVEEHLRTAVAKYNAVWGSVVLLDPRSGEVLAMASVPDYDPDEPLPKGADAAKSRAALERVRNRAISDSYEPGSIFKPFIAAPAVDERLARLDESFTINGPSRQFGGRIINDTHAYDVLRLTEVISKSSNIGMGLLGSRLGNERLNRFVRMFGFGDVTGLGLPGEHSGLVLDFAKWTSFSTQSIPIGQEIAVTPIQLVSAFSALCNDGLLYRPRIVRGVVAADGELLRDESEPIVVRRVLDPATAREFRMRALVETVTTGTGKQAAIDDYQVFGKTGTAQVARPNGRGYLTGAYVGSFVGGAPADAPRAAVIVSIYTQGQRQYYGGTVAAPTAGAILAETLEYLRVPVEVGAASGVELEVARP